MLAQELDKQSSAASEQLQRNEEQRQLSKPELEPAVEEEEDLESMMALDDGAGEKETDIKPKSVKYKALSAGAIRVRAEMDSDPAGKLVLGEIIEVSETKELGNGTVRVHFDRGWTSVTAKSGKVFLKLVVDEEENDDSEPEDSGLASGTGSDSEPEADRDGMMAELDGGDDTAEASEPPEAAMEDLEAMAASLESEAAEPEIDLEAMAAELAEPDGSTGGGKGASGEVRYTAVAKGVVRKAKGKDSWKVGNLDLGIEIVALEEEVVDGTTRVHFKHTAGKRDLEGWVSVTAAKGTPLLVRSN